MQRNWMATGVRNARRKATDNDKISRKTRTETSEKQAAKARQTQRMIERLDVVEEPRKEWELRMTHRRRPPLGRGRRLAGRRGGAARRASPSARSPRRSTGPTGSSSPAPTARASHPARRAARPDPGRRGPRRARLGGARRGDRPGPGPVPGPGAAGPGVRRGGAGLARLGGPHAAGQVRADLRARPRGRRRRCRPGERTRAALALLQADAVNLIVLDEPTNHLDLAAIEQLEQAVDSFPGTVLLVTHDRRMLDTVRSTRRWNVEHGRLTDRHVPGLVVVGSALCRLASLPDDRQADLLTALVGRGRLHIEDLVVQHLSRDGSRNTTTPSPRRTVFLLAVELREDQLQTLLGVRHMMRSSCRPAAAQRPELSNSMASLHSPCRTNITDTVRTPPGPMEPRAREEPCDRTSPLGEHRRDQHHIGRTYRSGPMRLSALIRRWPPCRRRRARSRTPRSSPRCGAVPTSG